MKPEGNNILLRGGQMWWTPSQMEDIVTPSAVCRHTWALINLQAEAGVDAVVVNITLHLNSGKKQHTHNCPNSTRSF